MFAVINLGMKSIRLCLLDERNRIKFKKAYPLDSVIFGHGVEQNAGEWWQLTQALFRDAETTGYKLSAIQGITVSASASCLICVDAEGNPLRPVIMVSDRRHHAGAGESREAIMLQRIRWLRENEPDIFAASAHLLAPNDYILFRLCGVAVTDPLNAEKSGYEIRARRYMVEDEAIRSRLPSVREVGEAIGGLRPGVAAELHLRPDTEVALSSYDAIVSVVGSGVGEEGTLCDVSGTVTSVRMQCRDARTHPTGAIACQGMPSLGCHYLGGSNNLGGGLIEWLKTTFYPASPHVYDMIQTDAQGVTAQDSRIVFLPYLMGERAPIWNPDARGVFFGVERMHSRKHFARATLEAAAFAGRTLIEAVGEAYGRPPAKVRLSGGLSRLEICSRIKADVYGLPLEIVSEFESTVLGAHLLAFHRRLGLTPGSRGWLDATVKVRDIVIPDDEAKATYDESFLMFKEIYAALQPVFLRHSQRTAKTMKSEDGYLENL